jgi:luciferase family oxidoreductase group 1
MNQAAVQSLQQTRYSILDLVPYPEGKSIADAYRSSVSLAQHAEKWGYHRYWMAEHHGLEGIASAATSILIGNVAGQTKTIRVGSGGIMLPNHAPLMIAEQFGTLETLYPNRIDLGLGRAPGTDQTTMRALRRGLSAKGDDFPELIDELLFYFQKPEPGQKVRAIPGEGLNIPIWILGSSTYSGRLAAMLGRPYAFAGHFAPDQMLQAFEIYRKNFERSSVLEKPYTMAGIPIIAAETDEEAEHLATSLYLRILSLIRGQLKPTPPPVDSMDLFWTTRERDHVENMMKLLIVGSPETIRRKLEVFLQVTQVDELIITSDIFDHDKRLESYRLISNVFSGASSSAFS